MISDDTDGVIADDTDDVTACDTDDVIVDETDDVIADDTDDVTADDCGHRWHDMTADDAARYSLQRWLWRDCSAPQRWRTAPCWL